MGMQERQARAVDLTVHGQQLRVPNSRRSTQRGSASSKTDAVLVAPPKRPPVKGQIAPRRRVASEHRKTTPADVKLQPAADDIARIPLAEDVAMCDARTSID